MLDVRKFDVRSIDDLIQALYPLQTLAVSNCFDATPFELRLMKSNISAVLSLVASIDEDKAGDAEVCELMDDVRRKCLLMNGMISRTLFRKRWLFSVSKAEDACEILAHYEAMADAANRMCRRIAPELGDNLMRAF